MKNKNSIEFWVTHQGKMLAPMEMEVNHLLNTIKYITNNYPPPFPPIYENLRGELVRRNSPTN